MTDSYLLLLLVGACTASLAMAALWVLAVRIGDASHVDVGWATLIAIVATLYAILADGDGAQRMLTALLASLWGWRLGLYLLFNRVLGKEEDGRYKTLRAGWGARANRNFFVFFQAQAGFVLVFSVPYLLISVNPDGPGWLELAGVGIWAIGNVGTIVADWQLSRWRADSAHRGKTARAGLWSWSRHPNYFFEWTGWCGVALVATAAPYGWIGWIAPAFLLFLLLRVTGIPATEAQAVRSRQDYVEYQQTTSVFVPLPPRRHRAEG
jgi:steroid 5-alpha reductase family enzyme